MNPRKPPQPAKKTGISLVCSGGGTLNGDVLRRAVIFAPSVVARSCARHLRQNWGVNRTSKEKTSNRPSSMVKLNTQVS